MKYFTIFLRFYSIKIRKTFLLWCFQARITVISKFFYIFHALAIIYVGTNICNVILRWVNSQWNQSWIFRGSRRWVRRIFMKYWFFSYIPRREWHNGGLPSARLDGSNTVGRCITVWNLSAVGVVTDLTSRYSCITCLRVAMSDIYYRTDYGLVCALLLNSKCGGLSR